VGYNKCQYSNVLTCAVECYSSTHNQQRASTCSRWTLQYSVTCLPSCWACGRCHIPILTSAKENSSVQAPRAVEYAKSVS